MVTAIFIYTKYVCAEFYYDVRLEEGSEPTFVVRQMIGKRETTLCRIDLSSIVKVEYEDKKAYRAHKAQKDTRVYNYVPTISPKGICRISMRNRYEKAEITVEITESLAGVISDYAKEARLARVEDDE